MKILNNLKRYARILFDSLRELVELERKMTK